MLYQELRARRKHARIIGVGLSVALLLIAVGVFIVIESLPSMTQLRTAYFSSRLHRPVSAQQLDTVSATTQSASSPTSTAPAPIAVASPTPAPTPAQRTLADYVTERFVDRGERTVSVCANLPTLASGQAPFDQSTLSQALNSQIQSSQVNAFAEAVLAPLGAILQMPNVASAVRQIRDAQESSGFVQQTQFYSSVAFAASDIYANRAMIDRVSDSAYHLSVLARIAAIVPGAGSDPALRDLCTAIEARSSNPLLPTPQDYAAERSALLQLIGVMGLTPQQAGFDPNLSTQISVQLTPTQLALSSPWMTQMYRSGLQLSVR